MSDLGKPCTETESCTLHNLQCRFPNCLYSMTLANKKKATPSTPAAVDVEARHEEDDRCADTLNGMTWAAQCHRDRAALLSAVSTLKADLAAAQGRADRVIKAAHDAFHFLDDHLGDTDPQDPDHPLIKACQLLAPFCEMEPYATTSSPPPGAAVTRARLATWLHDWFSKNGITAYLEHMPEETPNNLADALISAGVVKVAG